MFYCLRPHLSYTPLADQYTNRSGQIYYTTIQVIKEREEGDIKGESVLVRRITVENVRIGLVTIVHH